jgi:hypothetical protein
MVSQSTDNLTFGYRADPNSTDGFGTNVGDKILEKADFLSESATARRLPCNVGKTEQKIRMTAGAALIGAAAFAPLSRGWRIGLAVFGASQLITGGMSYCPLWQALGINTRQVDDLAEQLA